ncbi:MAG: flagellar biosynthesis protein FlhB [Alphaproteobacteria bacterium]|nr:flagellar biosynthesis protein FlhB [Alphaproteobacteria bacterium]
MAEDDSQKTEEPSWRKLDEARSKGQVAQSREVTNWFALTGMAASTLIAVPPLAAALQRAMQRFVAQSGSLRLDGSAFAGAILQTLADLLPAVALPIGIMLAAGLAAPLLQTGLLFAPERIAPKLDHLSPIAGVSRIFSMRSLVEFLKGLLKLAIVGAVAAYLLLPELGRLPMLPSIGILAMVAEIKFLALRLGGGVLAVLTVIAIADYVYQRMSFLKSLRMSKQELKDEFKQSEGDPFIKGKLRQIRTQRARKRMMAAVPKASVVITNPTHFAVALHYELERSGAPRVVAKGADLVAARIREVARAHRVPIVENPPVARALYATVELDEEIPPEHYKAVAEIISYVLRLKGKLAKA